jgi:ribosomal protein L30
MPAKSTGGGKKPTAKKATAKKATAKKATAKKTAVKTATAKKATAKKATVKKATKKAAPKSTAKKAAPPKRPATSKSSGTRVRVRQVRSGIGRRVDFRRTLEALGIRHHQGEVVVTRSPAIDGMLYKVRHLISVTPEE